MSSYELIWGQKSDCAYFVGLLMWTIIGSYNRCRGRLIKHASGWTRKIPRTDTSKPIIELGHNIVFLSQLENWICRSSPVCVPCTQFAPTSVVQTRLVLPANIWLIIRPPSSSSVSTMRKSSMPFWWRVRAAMTPVTPVMPPPRMSTLSLIQVHCWMSKSTSQRTGESRTREEGGGRATLRSIWFLITKTWRGGSFHKIFKFWEALKLENTLVSLVEAVN